MRHSLLAAAAALSLPLAAIALPDALLSNPAFTLLSERSEHVGPRLQALKRLGADNSTLEPQQLHLALTGDVTQMQIMWATYGICNGSVSWVPANASASDAVAATATATLSTYTAGIGGWSGWVHTAVMTNLVPGATYSYTVGSGDAETGKWSIPRTFNAAPAPSASLTSVVCVFGDMGTIMPLGWAVSDAITELHLLGRRFDLTLVAGDLSYATVTPPNGEVQWSWDSWQMQVEPYASTAPFMTTVGNHESAPGTVTNSSGSFNIDFAAFTARFSMPSRAPTGGLDNLWFSFDFMNFHVTSVSSEHPYQPTDPQYVWAAADLAQVDRSTTPWLIFTQHRHVVSSDESEYNPPSTSGFYKSWGPLLDKYKVDLVINGHQHMYERSQAISGENVVTKCDSNGTYTNPGAPIYLVIGTAGADQGETCIEPQPEWSALRRTDVYGFGRMTVTRNESLKLELIDIYGEVQDVFTIQRQ